MCLPSSRTCMRCTTGAEPPHSFEGRTRSLDGEVSIDASWAECRNSGRRRRETKVPWLAVLVASRGAYLCRDLVEPLADVAKPRG